MSESSWDDYVAPDSTTSDATITDPAPVEPALAPDTVSALDSAATADSWSDWNADTAQTFTDSAQSELDYAQQQYAAGWTDLGDAAVVRAEAAQDTADGYGQTAVDQAQTADSWTQEAAADQSYADYGTADTDTDTDTDAGSGSAEV